MRSERIVFLSFPRLSEEINIASAPHLTSTALSTVWIKVASLRPPGTLRPDTDSMPSECIRLRFCLLSFSGTERNAWGASFGHQRRNESVAIPETDTKTWEKCLSCSGEQGLRWDVPGPYKPSLDGLLFAGLLISIRINVQLIHKQDTQVGWVESIPISVSVRLAEFHKWEIRPEKWQGRIHLSSNCSLHGTSSSHSIAAVELNPDGPGRPDRGAWVSARIRLLNSGQPAQRYSRTPAS